MVSVRDTNVTYEMFMADYMSEEVLNGLSINSTLTLKNDKGDKQLRGFKSGTLKYIIVKSSVKNIVLQCQCCGELCDLQLDRKDNTITLYSYRVNSEVLQFYSLCKCKYYDILLRASGEIQIIPIRIKVKFREVAFAMKYFSVGYNANDDLPMFV